jgi:hypothetical protein
VRNPASLDIIGIVPDLGAREAMLAVAAVQRAAPGWSATTAVERESILLHAAELMQTHRDDLARIITLEQGKPLAESLGEIDYGINFVRWYAAEGRRLYGEIVPSPDPEKRLLVFREPIGLTLVITPGNDRFCDDNAQVRTGTGRWLSADNQAAPGNAFQRHCRGEAVCRSRLAAGCNQPAYHNSIG